MNNDLNLADIRAFTVIAKQGSFTRAAETLDCSRSHLSKQLAQLEGFLGVSLITRTTRAQRLTEQGRHFFEQCQEALETIEQAVASTVDNAQNLQGNININCVGGYIGEEIVTALVNDFIAQHPEISINLDFSSQRVDLVVDEFDLVFRMGKLEDSGIIARKLMSIENMTMASPQYLKRRGYPVHPKDLKDHLCITGSIDHWLFEQKSNAKNKVEVAIKGGFRCKNGRAMKASAQAGNGIVRLPKLYCPQELASGELVSVFEEWRVADTPLYLLYSKDRFQPVRLKAFVSFATQNFMDYV